MNTFSPYLCDLCVSAVRFKKSIDKSNRIAIDNDGIKINLHKS